MGWFFAFFNLCCPRRQLYLELLARHRVDDLPVLLVLCLLFTQVVVERARLISSLRLVSSWEDSFSSQ